MRAGARKSFLVIGIVVVGVAAAGSGLLVARFTGARGFPIDQLHEGVNAANLQITPVFAVRSGGEVLVLKPFAPDSTIPVAWCPVQRFFEDPATGSKFDERGRYLAGPAPRGMDVVSSKVVGGVLQIAPGSTTAGPPRTRFVPASALPVCDWATAVFAPGVVAPPVPTNV